MGAAEQIVLCQRRVVFRATRRAWDATSSGRYNGNVPEKVACVQNGLVVRARDVRQLNSSKPFVDYFVLEPKLFRVVCSFPARVRVALFPLVFGLLFSRPCSGCSFPARVRLLFSRTCSGCCCNRMPYVRPGAVVGVVQTGPTSPVWRHVFDAFARSRIFSVKK